MKCSPRCSNAFPRLIPLFSVALAILLTLGRSSYATPSQGAEQGRGTIAGEVTDQTGQRIPGAVVLLQTVSGQRRETTSDARGEFAFDDLASGPYRVTASITGFTTGTTEVAVEAGGGRRITLALGLDGITAQVTVTAPSPQGYDAPRAAAATRLNVPIIDTPVSVQVVPRRVIEDQAALGLEDVYTNVSGVAESGNTLNAQTEIRPMIRGFDTAVPLRNGLRATTVGAVDLVNIDSVEVLKGPASILYGAIEPGGVLNYVTKKPLMAPRYDVAQQFGTITTCARLSMPPVR